MYLGVTFLEITYVSVKFKLLHGESHKASSLCTYKLRCVPDLNEQNNENQKHFKGLLCDLCFLGIHQHSTIKRYQIFLPSLSDICSLWKVQRETHLSRYNQSLLMNHTIFYARVFTMVIPYLCGRFLVF